MALVDIEDILVRSLQGRTTPAEDRILERWRADAPNNEVRYQSLAVTWRMTAHYDPSAVADLPPPVVEVLRAAAGSERTNDRRHLRRVALVAALIVLSLGGGHLFTQRGGDVESGVVASGSEVVRTGVGERATVTLSDGTAVRVGPGSTLRKIRDGAQVAVWLEGRAFFGVHPDAARTFSVQTAQGEVVALGTRFEVRSGSDELQVAVVQGEVRVSAAGTALELGPGWLSRNVAGSPPIPFELASPQELLGRMDWMGPVLVFRRTPLEQAVTELSNRYGIEVTLGRGISLDAPVTGTLTDLTAEDAFRVLCDVVGASCVEEGDGYRMSGPRPDLGGGSEP